MHARHFFMRLRRDDQGATAIEYGLILAMIALGMLGAAAGMGAEIGEMWTWVEQEVLGAPDAGTPQPD